MVVIQADQGEWLSLVEASRRLGQSVQTLRRRIKEEKILSRRATTSHGIAWQVWVSNDDQAEGVGKGEDNQGYFEESNQEVSQQIIQEYATKGVLELISWLQQLSQENAQLHGRVANLESQLEQAQETIKALQAPMVEVTPEETIVSRDEVQPWWKNWLMRLTSNAD